MTAAIGGLAGSSGQVIHFVLRWLAAQAGRVVCSVASLAMVALVFPPLLWLTYLSVRGDSGFSTEHFVAVFSDPGTLEAIKNTVVVAVTVSLGATLLGVPLAWAVSRTDIPLRRTLYALAVGSFVLPPFLAASAWILLGGPNAGLLNRILMHLTGLPKGLNIFSLGGMAFVMILHAYPLVFLPVAGALWSVPADLEDAAQNLGAPYWKRLKDVTLPIARPAVLVGMVLAFFEALSEYGTPAVLGTPASVRVFTTELATYFQYPPMLGDAAALALPFLIAIILIQTLQRRLLGERRYTTITGGSGGSRTVRAALGAWRWPIAIPLLLVPTFAVILPGLVLAAAAVTRAWGLGLHLDNLTLDNFRGLVTGALGVAQAMVSSIAL